MNRKQVSGLIILFGATGDLAKKSLFPALHQLYQRGILSDDFAIIGASRTKLSDKEFRDDVENSVKNGGNFTEFEKTFLNHCFYQPMDNTKEEDYDKLFDRINEVKGTIEVDSNYIYYYSISPSLFDDTTSNLQKAGVTELKGNHRVLVEKPFGEDLESAKEYFRLLTNVFEEKEVYFIDHFNAMEYVQNILFTRFNNPVINQMIRKDYIENIQISLPEHLSVGTRGAFYDANGALLDMFQNHLLQILTMVAMKLPDKLDATSIHEKKLELLESIPTFTKNTVRTNIVRGQYAKDFQGQFLNYRDEPDVPTDSLTETYIALKLSVDLSHLNETPIYVRTGKALIENFHAVDIVFKEGARLTFYIQPGSGVQFVVDQKHSEKEFEKVETVLGPDTDSIDKNYIPLPYENVLRDGLSGDKMNFITFEEIQEEWRITDSIVQAWKNLPDPDFPNYTANTFGPAEADELLEKNNHQWIKRPFTK